MNICTILLLSIYQYWLFLVMKWIQLKYFYYTHIYFFTVYQLEKLYKYKVALKALKVILSIVLNYKYIKQVQKCNWVWSTLSSHLQSPYTPGGILTCNFEKKGSSSWVEGDQPEDPFCVGSVDCPLSVSDLGNWTVHFVKGTKGLRRLSWPA